MARVYEDHRDLDVTVTFTSAAKHLTDATWREKSDAVCEIRHKRSDHLHVYFVEIFLAYSSGHGTVTIFTR